MCKTASQSLIIYSNQIHLIALSSPKKKKKRKKEKERKNRKEKNVDIRRKTRNKQSRHFSSVKREPIRRNRK